MIPNVLYPDHNMNIQCLKVLYYLEYVFKQTKPESTVKNRAA